MRARLLEAWPGLSHYFGLHPWDVGRLTGPELLRYLSELKAINEATKEANRGH